MRGRAKLHTDEAGVEYVPKSLTSALEFDKVFSRFAPLEIDLGCGDGAFLAVLAQENPAHNFLGIERLLGRVRSVCRKVARLDLKNARILRMESNYAVTHLLPPGSVTAFHLLIPRSVAKTATSSATCFHPRISVSSIHRALIAGGLFHVATDHADYFHQIERVIVATDIFVISREQNHFPPTSFEQKYRRSRTFHSSTAAAKSFASQVSSCSPSFITELNFDRAGLVLAEKFDATLRDFLGPFLGDLFRDGRWTRRGNDNFRFYRLKKLGGARAAGMMLALDQNIALQIVTCFEQRRLRVRARVGLKKHTNVSQ